MYAYIVYTVLKWSMTPSQITVLVILQNNVFQTLLGTHIIQGPRFNAALGWGPRVSISNTFRGMPRLLVHRPHFEATLCLWVENQQVRVLPRSQMITGRRKGVLTTTTPGGRWRLTLPEGSQTLPECCNHVGNLRHTDAKLPPWEMLISFAWGVAWANVLSEAPQWVCCAELRITALVVDANGPKY